MTADVSTARRGFRQVGHGCASHAAYPGAQLNLHAPKPHPVSPRRQELKQSAQSGLAAAFEF